MYSYIHTHTSSRDNNTSTNNNHRYIHMVVPYTKGLSESFKNICGKVEMQVNVKAGNTIKSLLVTPKDRDNITQKSGPIYR